MRAVTWQGAHKVKVANVPDPQILNPRDAIVKVTATTICGSDRLRRLRAVRAR